MGISVEGQKCPVCGAYVFDNDDLVFCPECGAPHHRDCYEALGHCYYKDKHGTAEGYDPDAAKKEAEKKAEEANGSLFGDEPPFEEGATRCRFCGEPLLRGENVCHRCRRPQNVGNAGPSPFGGATIMLDPLGGVAPDEVIGEVTAKEIKDYVVVNTQRYVPRFKVIKKEKRKSWNWAAFLVPHAWFFYRKMYVPGILVTILLVTSQLLLFPFEDLLGTLPDEARRSIPALANALTNNVGGVVTNPAFYLAMGSLVLNILVRVVGGLVGDRIYFKSVTEGIKSVKDQKVESDLPLETALARKGSVNALLGLIFLFSFEILVNLVYLIYHTFI